MIRFSIALSLFVALIANVAAAQQVPLQGGSWVAGHVPIYSSSSSTPVFLDSGLPPGSPNVTVVASLPTCNSAAKGLLYVVTDASSPTYGAALTGGSSTTALALCDGSIWRAH